MVLGHWLEMKAISQASGALNAHASLVPDKAELVVGAETQTVPVSELNAGAIVLVRAGGRVPADGSVVEGTAEVDESMITGESKTVAKSPGATVIAGTVVSGGRPTDPFHCGRRTDCSLRHWRWRPVSRSPI
jgi:Cu2+-exporting ATPase